MDALSDAGDARAASCSATTTRQRVFTTVGPEQEYFLIDEQYYFERPDLVTTGRTLFGAKPPKGHELDDHYFGSIPERDPRLHARRRARAGQARRPGQDPPQRGRAEPVRDRADLREHERRLPTTSMLTMQIMQNVGAPLRPGLPAAREAVRRRQRLGQAQQLVDGHRHRQQPARAGRHAAREPAVPVLLRGRDPGGQQAPGAAARRRSPSAGQDHRLGANEAPPAIISIFLGDRARGGLRRRSPTARSARPSRARSSGSARRCCRRCRCTRGDRNRTSPFAFTGNKFEFRALGSSQSPSFPNTVLNTIVAEAIDDLSEKLDAALKDGATLEKAILAIVKDAYSGAQAASSSTATATPRRGTTRPRRAACSTCARRPTRCPWLIDKQTVGVFKQLQGALQARARGALRGVHRAVLGQAQHRGRDGRLDRADAAPAGRDPPPRASCARRRLERADRGDRRAGRRVRRRDLRARGGQRRPPRRRGRSSTREYMRDDGGRRRWTTSATIADRLEKIVADDLWPLPKYSEMLFIK